MTQLLLWMIMAYGITNIIVYGSIFNGPRNYINRLAQNESLYFQGFFEFIAEMIKCPMCSSVWIGFFLGIFIYSPVGQILGVNLVISWFFDGLLSSGAVWAINSIIEWFEENRPQNNNR